MDSSTRSRYSVTRFVKCPTTQQRRLRRVASQSGRARVVVQEAAKSRMSARTGCLIDRTKRSAWAFAFARGTGCARSGLRPHAAVRGLGRVVGMLRAHRRPPRGRRSPVFGRCDGGDQSKRRRVRSGTALRHCRSRRRRDFNRLPSGAKRRFLLTMCPGYDTQGEISEWPTHHRTTNRSSRSVTCVS